MSVLGHLLRLLAVAITMFFARQAAKGAEADAKTDPDDIGGTRG